MVWRGSRAAWLTHTQNFSAIHVWIFYFCHGTKNKSLEVDADCLIIVDQRIPGIVMGGGATVLTAQGSSFDFRHEKYTSVWNMETGSGYRKYRRLFPRGLSGRGVKVTTGLRLVPKLRTNTRRNTKWIHVGRNRNRDDKLPHFPGLHNY